MQCMPNKNYSGLLGPPKLGDVSLKGMDKEKCFLHELLNKTLEF